jgi:hypothetical protein
MAPTQVNLTAHDDGDDSDDDDAAEPNWALLQEMGLGAGALAALQSHYVDPSAARAGVAEAEGAFEAAKPTALDDDAAAPLMASADSSLGATNGVYKEREYVVDVVAPPPRACFYVSLACCPSGNCSAAAWCFGVFSAVSSANGTPSAGPPACVCVS